MRKYFTDKWESSYERNENYLFYPSDEVIRFVSRFIKKKTGINCFEEKNSKSNRILDACCGIGRNVKFGAEMGFEMYGFDLSKNAVSFSNEWLVKKLKLVKKINLSVSSIDELSYENNFFDHVICDSALDSMSFETAVDGISELYRVTKPGALFYCSLISGNDSKLSKAFNGEVIVKESHENGTIQSYFNKTKIIRLIEPLFEIISLELHNIIDNDGFIKGRWHVISKRRN
jgi:ubiquinone/menaquinone biosynthesis C-methylase UbiE